MRDAGPAYEKVKRLAEICREAGNKQEAVRRVHEEFNGELDDTVTHLRTYIDLPEGDSNGSIR